MNTILSPVNSHHIGFGCVINQQFIDHMVNSARWKFSFMLHVFAFSHICHNPELIFGATGATGGHLKFQKTSGTALQFTQS